jgi:hypothetical protein
MKGSWLVAHSDGHLVDYLDFQWGNDLGIMRVYHSVHKMALEMVDW